MVRLKLFKKPKHRAQYSYARALYGDVYAVLHRLAHTKANNVFIRRVAVFSVRLLAPRPARETYTKGPENLNLKAKGSR